MLFKLPDLRKKIEQNRILYIHKPTLCNIILIRERCRIRMTWKKIWEMNDKKKSCIFWLLSELTWKEAYRTCLTYSFSSYTFYILYFFFEVYEGFNTKNTNKKKGKINKTTKKNIRNTHKTLNIWFKWIKRKPNRHKCGYINIYIR